MLGIVARDSEPADGIDRATVAGFGFEWSVYDQTARDGASLDAAYQRYFDGFPWGEVAQHGVGLDVGCGTGRWAAQVVRSGHPVLALDAAREAVAVAQRALPHGTVVQGDAAALPCADRSLDFAFSLGVLHHVADPRPALAEVHRVLRPGAPFLVYLYYAFDGRPGWYRAVWRLSDLVRRGICRSGPRVRLAATRAIAAVVYLPVARACRLLERLGVEVDGIPLSAYRDQPLYVMRTDALDRFGTPVEHRFTRDQIECLLEQAGFTDVQFAPDWPYWRAVARA